MMSNSKPITLSIKELLSGESYVIPTYQRNYAWGVDELAQLIQDVADYASENPTGRYYIGTLVVFPRKNDEGAVIYETVDGQQLDTRLWYITECRGVLLTHDHKVINLSLCPLLFYVTGNYSHEDHTHWDQYHQSSLSHILLV